MNRIFRVMTTIGLAALLLGAACSEKPDDGTAPRPLVSELPKIELRDDTPNLLLTWVDDQGGAHVTVKPGDVPAEGRALVRVILSDQEHGTRDLFYVADLTQKGADGTYAVKTMPRREWEALIEKRREAHLAKLAPPPPPPPAASGAQDARPGQTPPVPGAQGVTVIIYGAEWCKPCHMAADYLKAKGVPVVVKDIDESPAAAAEMQQKLAKANRRGGSIPIIDVRGQILEGFNPRELDRAISQAASGTVL